MAATLYTALTGQKPCKSLDREKAVALNSQDPLVSPQQLNPEISDWVNRAILKGMQIQASDRSQTIQDWLSLLVPTSIELFKRAWGKQSNGDYQTAIQDYSEAIETNRDWDSNSGDPDSYSLPRAYHYRGNCRYRLQDWQGAYEDYKQAIDLKPDYASAYFDRGLSLKEANSTALALADFQKAVSLYQKQGKGKSVDYQNAQNQIEALTPPPPTLTSKMLFEQALAKQENKNYSSAVKDYTKAIETDQGWGDNSDADSYYGLATAHYNRGCSRRNSIYNVWKETKKDYAQAVKLKPDYAIVYYDRAEARFITSDHSGAIEDYNQAVQLKPDFASAYFKRALVHLATGNKQAGLADYQKAAELYQQQRNQRYQDIQKRIKALTSQPRTKTDIVGAVAVSAGGVATLWILFCLYAPPAIKSRMPEWFLWYPNTAPSPIFTQAQPSTPPPDEWPLFGSGVLSPTLPATPNSEVIKLESFPSPSAEEIAAQQKLVSTQLSNIKFEETESFRNFGKANFDSGNIKCFPNVFDRVSCSYTFDFEAVFPSLFKSPVPALSSELFASFYGPTGDTVFSDAKLYEPNGIANKSTGKLQFDLPTDLSKVSVIRFSTK